MMALSGVRSSWLILARNFDFGLIGLFGAGLFLGVFLRQIGELFGLQFQRLLRLAQIVDGGDATLLALDQPLFVQLDLGDVGADRNVAAVLGAPLADVHPASVVELRFEGARARRLGRLRGLAVVVGDGGADDRLSSHGDDRFVRRAGDHRFVGQVMQRLKVRIAQHQAIVGVPQHERFRYGLDGVAQPQIRGHRLLHQAFLLGNVDGDADQVQSGFAFLARQFAARPQPHPAAVGVTHAKGVIERGHLGVGELRGQIVEIDVVGMHQRVDFAEGEQIVLLRQAQNVEHRMRPEHAAARQVPIPQPAAAAVERGVDAAPHGVMDEVGLARPRRLPVEGEAENKHHEAGRCRQGDGERRGRSPFGERAVERLQHGKRAGRIFQGAHRGQGGFAVGQRDRHRVRAGAERGERLQGAEHVENGAPR